MRPFSRTKWIELLSIVSGAHTGVLFIAVRRLSVYRSLRVLEINRTSSTLFVTR